MVKLILDMEYRRGLIDGMELIKQKMLLACENGTPINIEGRAYFIKSDIQNLRDIFDDLEMGEWIR